MGGSQSTRKVTVDNDNAIQVSQEALDRIQAQHAKQAKTASIQPLPQYLEFLKALKEADEVFNMMQGDKIITKLPPCQEEKAKQAETASTQPLPQYLTPPPVYEHKRQNECTPEAAYWAQRIESLKRSREKINSGKTFKEADEVFNMMQEDKIITKLPPCQEEKAKQAETASTQPLPQYLTPPPVYEHKRQNECTPEAAYWAQRIESLNRSREKINSGKTLKEADEVFNMMQEDKIITKLPPCQEEKAKQAETASTQPLPQYLTPPPVYEHKRQNECTPEAAYWAQRIESLKRSREKINSGKTLKEADEVFNLMQEDKIITKLPPCQEEKAKQAETASTQPLPQYLTPPPVYEHKRQNECTPEAAYWAQRIESLNRSREKINSGKTLKEADEVFNMMQEDKIITKLPPCQEEKAKQAETASTQPLPQYLTPPPVYEHKRQNECTPEAAYWAQRIESLKRSREKINSGKTLKEADEVFNLMQEDKIITKLPPCQEEKAKQAETASTQPLPQYLTPPPVYEHKRQNECTPEAAYWAQRIESLNRYRSREKINSGKTLKEADEVFNMMQEDKIITKLPPCQEEKAKQAETASTQPLPQYLLPPPVYKHKRKNEYAAEEAYWAQRIESLNRKHMKK